MNAQEIFDTVVNHLRAQKVRSVLFNLGGVDVQCRYRGTNNTKCAIGCLIPDEEYQNVLEGNTLGSMIALGITPPTIRYMIMDGHKTLLATLQHIHDSNPDPKDWEVEFKRCAHVMDLQYHEPETQEG